jgi:FtsP/CotA-like multicopper oxidase with cupredoxin domain
MKRHAFDGTFAPANFWRRMTWQRWIAVVIFFALSVLLAGPFVGFNAQKILFSHNSPAGGQEQVGIFLLPNAHRSRLPKTLHFDWTITTGFRRPDGVKKEVYLVNGKSCRRPRFFFFSQNSTRVGEFPGPTIEARSGDRLVVRVRNQLHDDGLSLHWHGLRMKGNNSMDGAVGVTQCPIPAGGEFTYDFNVADDEHGTFWWHSHHKVQRGDGLFGGLVIYKPEDNTSIKPEYQVEEILLLVGDWFHQKQEEVLAWYGHWASMGNEPVPDSLQVNGHGRFICSMAVPARPVDCLDTAVSAMKPVFRHKARQTRLRVVNVGTIAGMSLAVDGARLKPLEVEGGCSVTSVESVSVGVLYPGERVDMMMSWTHNAREPWFNVYLDDE